MDIPSTEKLLRDLQPDQPFNAIRIKAARELGQLPTSDQRIVSALVEALKSDPSRSVRDAARESLQAPAHRAVLAQNPDLAASVADLPKTTAPQQTAPRPAYPAPPVNKLPVGNAPACSVCGRQDETLRIVIYPYVFSFIAATSRRAFAGLWCKKHRNLKLFLAALITATTGWLGIPFGIIFTPITLFRLARGGFYDPERNADMLQNLGEHKLGQGDAEGAARCFEASLRFRDDGAARERLRQIRIMHLGEPAPVGLGGTVSSLAGLLLGAVVIGAIIGILDYGVTALFATLGGDTLSIYLIIVSWAPLVAGMFVGGLLLSQLVEWALVRFRCRNLALAIGVSTVAAALALYSLVQGSAVSDYTLAVLSGGMFSSTFEAIFVSVMVLFMGGVIWIKDYIPMSTTADTIYIVLLLIGAVYYLALGIASGVRTARWQRRLQDL